MARFDRSGPRGPNRRMPIKVYEYKNCSTCQKALKYLEAKKIPFERRPIVDQPPTLAELKRMLELLKRDGGSARNLLNTSGQQYRELGMAEKLKAGMSEAEILKLLAGNGKLIKRPFMLTETSGAVGFKRDVWDKLV